MKYAIHNSPITDRIMVGKLNKKGDMFVGEKQELTNEAILAVIQHTLALYPKGMVFTVGDKTYNLEVKVLTKGQEQG